MHNYKTKERLINELDSAQSEIERLKKELSRAHDERHEEYKRGVIHGFCSGLVNAAKFAEKRAAELNNKTSLEMEKLADLIRSDIPADRNDYEHFQTTRLLIEVDELRKKNAEYENSVSHQP